MKTDITIVGGGFAGLAAALRLHRAGAKVRVIEKRPFFGGRAYSFAEPKTGQTVDNGQHLLMGAYQETFQFLRELGTLQHLQFQDGLEVCFARDAARFYTLKCPKLPAPWHLALGLLRFKGLNFGDKRKMLALVKLCKKADRNGDKLDEISVAELFRITGQTPQAVKMFWEPLALATLNESIEAASAQLFREVLRQGLLNHPSHSKLVIPRVGFSELYAAPAQRYFEAQGVPLHFQTQILRIEASEGRWRLHSSGGETFESRGLLLAVPPNALGDILKRSAGEFHGLLDATESFSPSPIVSINLWYESFDPTHSFVGLVDSPIHWIFNKAKILHAPKDRYVSLVISGAYGAAEKSKDALVALAVEELSRFYPELKGAAPRHAQVIKEYQATFHGRTGQNDSRPGTRTPFPGLYLAGDWTDTGLPATIESAVLSGHRAADAFLESER